NDIYERRRKPLARRAREWALEFLARHAVQKMRQPIREHEPAREVNEIVGPGHGYAAFFMPLTRPSRTRLSAVDTSASSRERGSQSSNRLAFAFVPFFFLPSSGVMSRIAGSRKPASRTRKFGNSRVGTFAAAAPILALMVRA